MISLRRFLANTRSFPSMSFASAASTSGDATNSDLFIYKSESNDAALNLATEEWLFRNAPIGRHTLFLWRNDKVVIVGRNQNVWKECHMPALEEHKVQLVRRGSGGGCVYQPSLISSFRFFLMQSAAKDLGNTCFTFISPMTDYSVARNNKILTDALQSLGITATPAGRNDLHVDGRKISGAAYKQNSQRAFHHGTLLINVDMSMMGKLLNPNKAKLQSKGVASVQQRVLNLQSMFPNVTHEALSDAIEQKFLSHNAGYSPTTKVEHLNLEKVRSTPQLIKYYDELSSWDWRFGRNPEFSHQFETRFDWGTTDIRVEVKDSVIVDASVFSDTLRVVFPPLLASSLIGVRYDRDGIDLAILKCRDLLTRDGGASDNATNTLSVEDSRALIDVQQWLKRSL